MDKAVLLAGLEAIESQIETLQGRHVVEWRVTDAVRQEHKQMLRDWPTGRPAPPSPEPYEMRLSWGMIQSNGATYADMERWDASGKQLLNRVAAAFDGTTGYATGTTGASQNAWGQISTTPATILRTSDTPWNVFGLRLSFCGLSLTTAVRNAKTVEYEGVQRVRGNDCHRLRATGCASDHGATYTVVADIDVKNGFLIRSMEIAHEADAPGAFRAVYSIEQFRFFPTGDGSRGVPLATVYHFVDYFPGFKTPKSDMAVRVEELALNAPVDSARFRIDFPVGTLVTDQLKDKTYVAGDGSDALAAKRAQEAMEGLSSGARPPAGRKILLAAPPQSGIWWVAAIASLSVIVLLAALWLAVHQRGT